MADAPWIKRFLVGMGTTDIDTVVTIDGSVASFDTGKPLALVTNDPTIDSGFTTVEQVKATGLPVPFFSGGGGEIQVGVSKPTVSLEMDLNANNLAVFGWSLFQKGASEAVGTPFLKTFEKYADVEAEVWLTVVEMLSASVADKNRVLHGGVVKSLAVSSDAGSQSVKATAEIFGGGTNGFAATYDASSVVTVDPAIDVLLFKDMICEIDTLPVYLDGFSFTIDNGLSTKPYNNTFTKRHILNRLTVEGELTLPKDNNQATLDDNAMLAKYIANTDWSLELFWGASPASTNGQVAFAFNCLATGNEELDSDGELANRIPFKGVYDGTNESVSVTCADTIDRTIP